MTARPCRLLAPACLLAGCLAATALPVRAQGAQPPELASSGANSTNAPAPASGGRSGLPRVFYAPSQRHELEVAEAQALSGLDESKRGTTPAVIRFNGWLSGPGPTHAWINGKAHVGANHAVAITDGPSPDQASAGRDPSMAAGPERPADPVLTPTGDSARFDPESEQLIIVHERGTEVRLRAGQSEDQQGLSPVAGAGEASRRQRTDDSVPLPLSDPPATGVRP